MRTLIAYYSRRGQNLLDGRVRELDIGNTELLAALLQALTGAERFRIEPEIDYPPDYYRAIDLARQDLHSDRCPPLRRQPPSARYDRIYLGYPNFWGALPMPVRSFLRGVPTDGVQIRPFCTHEGGGLGSSEQQLRALCPQALVLPGLAVRGSELRNLLRPVEAWAAQAGPDPGILPTNTGGKR